MSKEKKLKTKYIYHGESKEELYKKLSSIGKTGSPDMIIPNGPYLGALYIGKEYRHCWLSHQSIFAGWDLYFMSIPTKEITLCKE